MSESKTLIRPLLTNDVVVAAMNAKTDSFPKVTTIPAILREANNDSTIVLALGRSGVSSKLTRQNLERDIPIQ